MESQKEIFHLSESEMSGSYSENALKIRENSHSEGYGIRVIRNKKIGFAFCISGSELKDTIEGAINSSKCSPQVNMTFSTKTKFQRVKAFDKKIADLEENWIKDCIYEIKNAMGKSHQRIHVSAGVSEISLENSEGFDSGYKKTLVSAYAEATVGNGFGYCFFADTKMTKNFSEIGEKSFEMAKQMKNAGKPKSGEYDVVFSIESLHEILEVLMPSFSGEWKRRKMTKLGNKLDRKIFSENFTLIDDGTADGTAAQPFDDEGTVAKPRPLIENGTIKTFMFDRENAAQAKESADGFCTREDFSSPVKIGNSNLIIKPGKTKYIDDEISDYLLVKSLHGAHTANTITGDFGVEVNVAFHVKNEKQTPVRGFLISGNVFNLFNSISSIEKSVEKYSNLISPRIAFSNIKVVS